MHSTAPRKPAGTRSCITPRHSMSDGHGRRRSNKTCEKPSTARRSMSADLNLTEDQVDRIASMFSVDPATVRRMTFTNIPQSSRRLIAGEPRQSCSSCLRIVDGSHIILRSQLLGWRITCPLCGGRLQTSGGRERPSPFRRPRESNCSLCRTPGAAVHRACADLAYFALSSTSDASADRSRQPSPCHPPPAGR